METVLVTGAARGIGLELCKQFLQRGYKVMATYRGTPSAELSVLAESADCEIFELEVTDQAAVNHLSEALRGQTIDILLNNAGIIGPEQQDLHSLDVEQWMHTFAVNTVAPLMLSRTLLDNLKMSANGRILTVSSQMGSLSLQGIDMGAYRSSKAALNKAMQVLALELRDLGITVCPFHPGWVQTEMGGASADITPEQSAAGICDLAARVTLEDTGTFFTWEGKIHDW